jgi:hypothetical protein
VRRDGVGDYLADGTYWAARRIGKGAEKFDHNTIKKHEQLPLKLGMLNPVYYLMYCTGEKINITQIEGQFPQEPFPTREAREEFVSDWFQVPDEKFKKYYVDWEPRGEMSNPYYPTVEAACEIVDWMEKMHYIDDALGTCAGLSSFPLKPPYHIHNFPTSSGGDRHRDGQGEPVAGRHAQPHPARPPTPASACAAPTKAAGDHWRRRFPDLEKQLLDGTTS